MAAFERAVASPGPSAASGGGISQWQIFNELDLKEEAEMLDLARFLDSLIAEFSKKHRNHSIEMLNTTDEDEEDEEGSGGEVSPVERAAAAAAAANASTGLSPAATRALTSAPSSSALPIRGAGSSFRVNASLSQTSILPEDADIANFGPLPKGPLAPETAACIVEVYKRGGKLSPKSVKKVLRDVYKKLKLASNVVRVPVETENVSVHVIGDLHGQLPDLLHILEEAGTPSAENKFIFNGDYVDRGANSIEIVMILFSMHLAWPDFVFLNRGNHEDHAICCQPPPPHGCGGFQKEVKAKYDDLIFSMVVEVFRYLPLVHILDSKVLIIHGGLFYRRDVLISDLEAIDRLDYVAAPEFEPLPTTPEEHRAQDLRQLMRDALWSDPKQEDGLEFNTTRRQGQLFGPDVTAEFLQTNNLKMVVRSHECVKLGFDQPYETSPHSLCTIFSASGYSGSNNLGAYMTFGRRKLGGCSKVGGEGDAEEQQPLFFSVHDYTFTEAGETLEQTNKTSLRALIIRQKQNLLTEFTAADEEQTGKISIDKWASIMGKVTGVLINWAEILHLLGIEDEDAADGQIDYRQFTGNLRAGLHKLQESEDTESLFNAMYANRAVLEVVFNFFDTNGDGVISREEFHTGCKILNDRLPDNKQIHNPDAILRIMDFDGNEGIDINEFFEVFRIVDAMDGEVDGRINVAREEDSPAPDDQQQGEEAGEG